MITVVDDQTTISFNERIAQYGDGCFATMAVTNGQIELLAFHVERLKKACVALSIEFHLWQELDEALLNFSKNLKSSVVKVLISRGTGGRGYGTTTVSSANCYLSKSTIPDIYSEQRTKGIRLGVSTIKLASQPMLAGIKHANRLEQVLAKIELESNDYDDSIVCDTAQNIIESTAANIFLYKENTWYTPVLDNCGIEGVMRNFLMSTMSKNGLVVKEKNIPLMDLKQYQHAFICNSLMKIIPINSVEIGVSNLHNYEPNHKIIDWFKSVQQEVSLDA